MSVSDDRRGERRAMVSVPAEVLIGGRRRSFAWLKNLSPSGAMLRSAVALTPGARIRLLLHPVGHRMVEVAARVVESRVGEHPGSYTAGLELTTDARGDGEELARISAAASVVAAAPRDHAVLIIMDDLDARHELEEGVAALGHRPVVVSTPLDAIVWLQDASAAIDAVVASDRHFDVMEFFAFLADSFSATRRIVAIERSTRRRARRFETTRLVEAVVGLPVEGTALASALAASGPSRIVRANRS